MSAGGMPADQHVETVRGREFRVGGYPAAWGEWSFEAKVRWLIGNTSPRCSYGEACALLSAHRRARSQAEAARRRSQPAEARGWAAARDQADADGTFW